MDLVRLLAPIECSVGGVEVEIGTEITDVIRASLSRMTMLSFRVAESEAAEIQRWAQALGVDRSEILREALHRHLVQLRGEDDAAKWERTPAIDAERSLADIAEWGPAEDWTDWDDAAR